MDYYGSEHGAIDLNPATYPNPSTVQITDVLPPAMLEMANWNCITMTSRGTVLFLQPLAPSFLVTPDDLETGHITMYKSLEEVEEDRVGGNAAMNSDLDMSLPVIDILEGAKARGELLFGFDGDRHGWTEVIEICAPGYLEMEAAGNETNYDHSRLIDLMEAYDIRRRMYEAELA
ncbi:hypothetical protein BDW66DRAFT_154095 [Aspergillus desertorum]